MTVQIKLRNRKVRVNMKRFIPSLLMLSLSLAITIQATQVVLAERDFTPDNQPKVVDTVSEAAKDLSPSGSSDINQWMDVHGLDLVSRYSSDITKEERELLYRITAAEALGEPFEGKVAVVNVIMNRVKSDNFPDTIHEVVYQRGQFSPVGNGSINTTAVDLEVKQAVQAALKGHQVVGEDVLYFLNERIASNLWIPNNRIYAASVGQHSFYR